MLKQRVITALVLVPIALWGFFYLEGCSFALFIGAVVTLGAWEWARLAGLDSSALRIGYAVLCAVLLYFLWNVPEWSRLIVLLGIFWWGLACLLVAGFPESATYWKFNNFKYLIGFLILIPAWQGLMILKQANNGNWLILAVMVFVWTADIGAYFSGRQWGKDKLASKVSPGKSWQGFWGGLIAVLVIALFVRWYTGFASDQLLLSLLCVVILVVFSVLGDLTESMFKREAGLKDSSNLLPGHGGILDRIDSLTAAIPVSVLLLWVLGVL